MTGNNRNFVQNVQAVQSLGSVQIVRPCIRLIQGARGSLQPADAESRAGINPKGVAELTKNAYDLLEALECCARTARLFW